MRIVECEQGSPLWLKAREGKITASRMADVLNYLKKGGESQKRADYRVELIAERLTGLAADYYVSPEMKWGTEQEPFARSAYEIATGNFLERVGFVLHPTFDYAGASPDGLFGSLGGAEFKCPKSTTHLEYVIAGEVPEAYIPQMDMEMLCCDRAWMDFVSFDPRMPKELQLFICRLRRDDTRIAALETEIVKFEAEINDQIARLYGGAKLLRQGAKSNHARVPESPLLQSLHCSIDEVPV